MTWDVLVVGARCAGATLAAMLARSGVRVLVIDADALPSDMPMSTHFIHAPGMDVLDQIGVGAGVRAKAPASRRNLFRIDTHDVVVDVLPGREAYCVKRSTVDAMLLEAATSAGATLRDRTRLVELLRDGERVVGAVVESPSGRETIHASLVVGADGRNSTVAKLTGVEEYLGADMPRVGYWFYFPAHRAWHDDARYADVDVFMGYEGDSLRYVFQCDDDQLLMLAAPPRDEGSTWGKDYRSRCLDYLRASEFIRPLLDGVEPLGKGMGITSARFFYRRPVGPGFALVGDAGNFKDYSTGHGMTDAFLGAKRLHGAIVEGTEAAFERYWRTRDAETLPLYYHALLLGEVGYNNAFNRLVFERVARDPELAKRFAEVSDRKRSPFDALTTGEILKILLGGVLRGRFDAIGPFLEAGRRMGEYAKEIDRRKSMVDILATA